MTNHPADDFDLGPGSPVPCGPSLKPSLDKVLEHQRIQYAISDVAEELAKATAKFGPQRSAHEGYAILKEEVDELWDEIKKNDKVRDVKKMRAEAMQVAAMAIRFMVDVCKPFPVRDLTPKAPPALVEISKPDRRVTPCDRGAADRRGIVTVDLGPGTVSIAPIDEKGGFGKFKDYTKVDSFPVSFKERRVSPVVDRRVRDAVTSRYKGPLRRENVAKTGDKFHDRRKKNTRVERRFVVRRQPEKDGYVGRRNLAGLETRKCYVMPNRRKNLGRRVGNRRKS